MNCKSSRLDTLPQQFQFLQFVEKDVVCILEYIWVCARVYGHVMHKDWGRLTQLSRHKNNSGQTNTLCTQIAISRHIKPTSIGNHATHPIFCSLVIELQTFSVLFFRSNHVSLLTAQ